MPPSRPRPLRREVLEGYRRDRVVAAVAELARQTGIAGLTTTGIIRAARMSRNTFYELFEAKGDCLEFACEFAVAWLAGPVRAAAETTGPPLGRLDAAVGALLGAAAADPPLAELCLVHSPAISARGSESGGEVVTGALAETLASGREAWRGSGGEGRREPPAALERFVAGAIVSLLTTRLRHGEAEDLAGLREEMTSFSAHLLEAEFAVRAEPGPAALAATA